MVSETGFTYLSSLLTKSPNPGVSTTVRRRRTPFSSMSEKDSRGQCGVVVMKKDGDCLPALMLWMATVWGRSAFGAGGSLGG